MRYAVMTAVLAVIAGVLGMAAPAHAAVGEISGVVIEYGTTNGIGGVTVSLYDDLDPLTPVATMTTPSTGQYSFPVSVVGDYSVSARSDDWVEEVEEIDHYDPSAGFIVPPMELRPGIVLAGVARDAQTGLGVPGVLIFAFDSTWSTDPFEGAGTVSDSTGAYRVTVPLDGEYQLIAFPIALDFSSLLYWPQVWDHLSFFSFGCTCGGEGVIESPSAQGLPPNPNPPSGFDFDLWSVSNVLVSVQAWDDTTLPGVEYPGLTTHLYKKSGSKWVEVDSRDTDSSGFADVFGPQDKSLRLRFSLGGVFVPVEYADDDYGNSLELGKNGCWVDLGKLHNDSSFEPFPVEVSLDTTRPACPATMPSAPGGTPAVPPKSSPFDGLSAITPTPTPSATATPTPTPSATPTPTSVPTSEPSPEPSESATSAPEPVPASADLWWVWVLVIFAAVGILVLMFVLLRRR
jgi:hypothetical protein